MCEKGVNVAQMRLSVAQVDDLLALAQEWLEQLHHLADHGQEPDASAKLAQVGVALGEARGKLEQTIDGLGKSGDDKVSVELV
jgi:hypothetical protein